MEKQELLLVCEVFKVFLTEESYDLLSKMKVNTNGFCMLPNTSKSVQKVNNNFKDNLDILESLIVERLDIKDTDIFDYLVGRYYKIKEELGKSWNINNPSLKAILEEAIEITKNYIGLAISTPELFKNCVFVIRNDFFNTNTMYYSNDQLKKVHNFLKMALFVNDAEIIISIFSDLQDEIGGLNKFILNSVYQEMARFTIFDSDFEDLMNLLVLLLKDDQFKTQCLEYTSTKQLKNGFELDFKTFFGNILTHSLIPLLGDKKMKKFDTDVAQKIINSKTKNAYEKNIKNIIEIYRRHVTKVHQIAKTMMKKGLNTQLDGAQLVMNYLRDAISLNLKRTSMAYQFDRKVRMEVSSNAFGLGMLDVVIMFTRPIVQKDNLFAKVDFNFMQNINNEFYNLDANFFNNKEIKVEESMNVKNFGSATKFFFYMFEYISKFFVSICKHLEELDRIMRQLKKKLKRVANPMQKKMIESQISMFKTEFVLYRVAISEEERIDLLNDFYKRFFNHILKDKKNINIPEHYLLDYIEIQNYFTHTYEKYYSKKFGASNLKVYMEMLQTILSDDFSQSSPHVRAKFLHLLFIFNYAEENLIINDLSSYLDTKEKLKNFVLSMVRFYSAVEFMTDAEQTGQNKYQYRYFITKFLLKALDLNEYREALHANIGSKEMSDFIGHMLTDLNYFLDEAFANIERLKEEENKALTREMGNLNMDQNQDNNNEEEANLEQTRSLVTSYLKNSRSYLKLFDKISELDPEILTDKEWVHRVAQLINYYAMKMCTKNYKKIRFNGIKELGLRPLDFIKQLVSIYVRLSFSDRIKEEIINDERSYSKETLVDIGATAYKKELVSSNFIEKFEDLILELEALKIEKDDFKEIIGEAPDEFCCELTFDFMKNPVKLPSSELTVELSAIKQHFTLNGEYDPYTRQKLTMADLIPLPELQKKIDIWFEDKKEQFKKKLKKKNEMKDKKAKNKDVEYSDDEGDDKDESELIGFN